MSCQWLEFVVRLGKLKIDDDDTDMAPILKKVMGCKLFEDADGGLWKESIQECQGEILCSEYGDGPVSDPSQIHCIRYNRRSSSHMCFMGYDGQGVEG